MMQPTDSSTSCDRRKQNELIFANLNMDRLEAARELLTPSEQNEVDIQIYCECADPWCVERIPVLISEYLLVHTVPGRFIVRNLHQQLDIEYVVGDHDKFLIVQKF